MNRDRTKSYNTLIRSPKKKPDQGHDETIKMTLYTCVCCGNKLTDQRNNYFCANYIIKLMIL